MLMLGTAAVAQMEPQPSARVNIPFDFYAGSTSLPAGEYLFDVDPVNHSVIVVQVATGHSIFLSGMPASPELNGKSVLTFNNAEGEPRLTELRTDIAGLRFAPVNVGYEGSYGSQ